MIDATTPLMQRIRQFAGFLYEGPLDATTPLMQRIRQFWPLVNLCIGLLIITAIVVALDDRIMARTLTEGMIRVVIVVALYIFIGNSGIMSFGHIGFMMVGAYATGWQTCCEFTREMFMPGLPYYLLNNSHHFVLAIFLAGLLSAFVAFVAGIALMRLSGNRSLDRHLCLPDDHVFGLPALEHLDLGRELGDRPAADDHALGRLRLCRGHDLRGLLLLTL